MRITKLGHACVRIEHDGTTVVIDPGVFTDPSAVDGVDAVLVTHEHPDHYLAAHLEAADAPVLTIEAVAAKIREDAPAVAERLTVVTPGSSFVAGLPVRPGYVLSDGFRVPGLSVPSLPVVNGDAAAACIAAASVLAKVSRDRLMVELDDQHPGYGFADHKGYSTAAHGAALASYGPCSQHRQSFINVRRVARAGRTELVAGFAVGQDESTSFDTTGTEGQLSR